ncbi:MAG: formylglycine-generating enzyme family protein [Planctomycetes bacterium]|nr:formylglycine-generating enzyme family protein [Planctomycetota bacterium]
MRTTSARTPSSSRERPREHGAARAIRLALLLALSAPSCGEAREDGPTLDRLERLAFVPAGQLSLSLTGRGVVTIDVREPLLVDSFEVTRAEWLGYQRSLGSAVAPELLAHTAEWSADSGEWPACFMTQPEAEAFASAVGMRLPRAGEWIFIACGPQALPFPWGATAQRSVANTLELGLARAVAVGTFEAGRSPQRVYDLLGNVAEWSADLAPERDLLAGDERVSVLGGSYHNRARAVIDPRLIEGQSELFARALSRESRADDVGLRCVANAAEYLVARLPRERPERALARRYEALGHRWGVPARGLLEELSRRADASPALEFLLAGASR